MTHIWKSRCDHGRTFDTRCLALLGLGILLGITPAMATNIGFTGFAREFHFNHEKASLRLDMESAAGTFLDQDLTSDSFNMIPVSPEGFSLSSNVFDDSVAPTVSGGVRAELNFRGSAKSNGTQGYLASFLDTSDSVETALSDPNNGVSLEYSRAFDTNGVNFALPAIRDDNIVQLQTGLGINGVPRIAGVIEAPEPAPAWAMGLGLTVIALNRKRKAQA